MLLLSLCTAETDAPLKCDDLDKITGGIQHLKNNKKKVYLKTPL